MVPAVDQNGSALPQATMQQRLDIGDPNNAIPEGPVYGTLLQQDTIRFVSKVSGSDYHVENVVNYTNASEDGEIKVEEVVPNLNVGDFNTGNNGMGGFVITI